MTEQEQQTLLNQLKEMNIFSMFPNYSGFSKDEKLAFLNIFEKIIISEKSKITNEYKLMKIGKKCLMIDG